MADRIVTAGKAERTPNWDKWRLIPEPRLWQCVALSLNIDPDTVEISLKFGWDHILPRRLREFLDKIDVACANLQWTLPCTAVEMDRPAQSRVNLRYFAAWVRQIEWDAPQELLAIERQRPQNVNWDYWKALDLWPLDTACKLICGYDPNEPTRREDIENPDIANRPAWVNVYHQAVSAMKTENLIDVNGEMTPSAFIAWAGQTGWTAPPELLAIADNKDKRPRGGSRTGAATARREARKADRAVDLERFIEDVCKALDKGGHEIRESDGRKRLPVSAGDLHTLFLVRHPEHEVAQSTFDDDLGKIVTLKPGPKRYEIKELAEILAGKISVD